MNLSEQSKKKFLTVRETVLFAMLGTLMFTSKILLEILPNIHLLATFTTVYTVVFRKKALIPIYVFVFINGLWSGFAAWWIPYLYIWTVLWAVVMLLPRNMSPRISMIVYPLVCGLHGILYGTLYAPAQALLFGLDFKQTLLWIMAGLPWDAVHAVGNLASGFLVLPLVRVMNKVIKSSFS
ncbi:MAG: hypothetical protein IKL05_00805 [Clostridia bacterium]|nr:hypothetical protein [Clostridia bacterium]